MRQTGILGGTAGLRLGGMTTRALALTDAPGNLVRFALMPGHRFGTIAVEPLFDRVRLGGPIVNKAYDTNAILADLNQRNCSLYLK